MTLRTLLVHLDGGERASLRLKLACDLARARNARLTGVFARVAPPHQVGLVGEWPPRDYAEAAAASRAAFEAATQGLSAQWIDLNRGNEADLIQQMLDLARHFDLIVLGQHSNGGSQVPPELAEQLIINSGRPVLIVPHSGDFPHVGQRPIFTWTDSGSAARGFCDGLLLAARDSEALIVALSRPDDRQAMAYQKESLRLAVEHLAAHDISARSELLVLSEIGLMDALLNRASDHGADLLALGAFGGGGYPLFSRGSGSRYMLKHITLPTLFSH